MVMLHWTVCFGVTIRHRKQLPDMITTEFILNLLWTVILAGVQGLVVWMVPPIGVVRVSRVRGVVSSGRASTRTRWWPTGSLLLWCPPLDFCVSCLGGWP